MFTKSTLKFAIPAALLFAGVNANAQNNVMLKDGTFKTWDEVVAMLNSASSSDVTDLETKLSTAKKNLSDFEGDQTIKTDAPYLLEAIKASSDFLAAFDKWDNEGGEIDPDTPTVWYKLAQKVSNKQWTLNLSFSEVDGYTQATVGKFYTGVLDTESAQAIQAVNVILNGKAVAVTDYTSADQASILTIVDTFLNSKAVKDANQVETPNPEYEALQKAVTDAQAALDGAQNNENLTELDLTGDVTVNKIINNFTGTIYGHGHIINVPTGGRAFTDFSGTIENVAVNGTFARNNTGKLENVAIWTGSTGNYYDAKGTAVGTEASPLASIGAVAFEGRATYGVTNGKLAAVTDANKVYSITVYNSATATPTYFVTAADGKLINLANNQAVTLANTNVFVKSATDDLDVDGVNVYYVADKATTGTAKTISIADKQAFYCPIAIDADEIKYDREFAVGHATACLPFTVTNKNLGADLSTFTKKDDEGKTFEFTYTTEVAAGEPMLLTVKTAGAMNGLSGTILKTETEATFPTQTDAVGLLSETAATKILGSTGGQVWGLQEGTFKYANTATTFPAFRMVILTTDAAGASEAPRKIVIRDEYGQESGVDNVATDAAVLEVVGGVGELTISTSTDLGDVAVYSIDGRVAANVNATAGITTVDLAKGVYIVMGKKVLVK